MLKKNLFFKQKLVKAVNNLVEKDELVAWSRMKEERRERTITKLLHVVEESALSLANNYKTPTEHEIKATEMGEIITNRERHSITLNCPIIYSHVCVRLFFDYVILIPYMFILRIETLHF